MIVVEGPDGGGKTTLIRKLVEGTGLEVAPRVVSKDAEAMVDLVSWVEQNVARGWTSTIFDRHRLISEPIYGPLLRSKLEPGFDDPLWFGTQLRQFYANNPVIIYCLPPYETVYNNVKYDPDNKVVSGGSEMRIIWSAYLNHITTSMALAPNRYTYLYDYTKDPNGTVARQLVETIRAKVTMHDYL